MIGIWKVLSIGVASFAIAGFAQAQRFSAPEPKPGETKPAETKPEEAKPAAEPQPAGGDDIHRVGGGHGGFKLPLTLYDEKADAAADIKRAREEAKKDNRRVLVMWGENKCEFCAYLNELMTTDPQIRQLIETEYVWVKVDIGKFDKNIDLANRYNTPVNDPGDPATGRPSFGAPALTVVDAVTDQAITSAGGNAMVAKPMMPPRVFDQPFVLNLLAGGRPTPQVANMLMLEAQQKAKTQGKKVLVYFNVWGSDACKVWERVATNPAAAEVLGKAFVVRKIDTERHVAGETTIRRLKGTAAASPPWMTVVGEDGKPVAEAGKGIAFDPTTPDETLKWLGDASGGKLSEEDKATIAKAIAEASKPAPPVAAPVKEEANAGEKK